MQCCLAVCLHSRSVLTIEVAVNSEETQVLHSKYLQQRYYPLSSLVCNFIWSKKKQHCSVFTACQPCHSESTFILRLLQGSDFCAYFFVSSCITVMMRKCGSNESTLWNRMTLEAEALYRSLRNYRQSLWVKFNSIIGTGKPFKNCVPYLKYGRLGSFKRKICPPS